MLQIKLPSDKREFNLPIYSLCEKKDNVKSCFVNSNRVDTVRSFVESEICEEHEKKPKVLIKK